MKKIFNIEPKNFDGIILVIRLGIALLMLVHGLPKLEKLFSGEPVHFMSVLGMGPGISLALAVFAEVACSILILIGLGTRVAVIPLIITMLVAVFIAHAEDPFSKQELGLHYLLVYVMLLFTGSGRFSIDRLLTERAN